LRVKGSVRPFAGEGWRVNVWLKRGSERKVSSGESEGEAIVGSILVKVG